MSSDLEQLVRSLAESGIISLGKLENFLPPNAAPRSAAELAHELVRQKHLTEFQAHEIYSGRGKKLILGNYTLLDRIGAGGMGQVFKAQHRRMNRVVALKMLPAETTHDRQSIARFEREVQAAAQLSHPNIVAALDAGESNGVHFLVMEYVVGSDLSALVKAHGPVAVQTAVDYILQAARGLKFAHRMGVIHRDIKPSNLLLDAEGTVKILDMGLARLDKQDAHADTQAQLTGTGAILGTVDFMSPEQALDVKRADARADIYSLGCTLHFLITGKTMYDGNTVVEKLVAHREKPIPSLSEVLPEVPHDLVGIFRKMVAKSVVDRYPAMSPVIADLKICAAALGRGGRSSAEIEEMPQQTVNLPQLKVSSIARGLREIPLAPAAANARHRRRISLVCGAIAFLLLLLGLTLAMREKAGIQTPDVGYPGTATQLPSEMTSAPTAVVQEQKHPWPADAISFGAKRFKLYQQHLSWQAARSRCIELGGRLAEVRSGIENDFLVKLAANNGVDGVWLGASDEAREGGWVWSDGSPLMFHSWDNQHPDPTRQQPNDKGPGGEDHLMLLISLEPGKWWDQPDESGRGFPAGWMAGFICEWDALTPVANANR